MRKASRLGSPAPALLAVSLIGVAVGCSNPVTSPPVVEPPIEIQNSFTLSGAGDIAECGKPGSEQTARLLDGIPGDIFTAGDNVYPSGRMADFLNCYAPTWGRHKDRTHPIPGNHDYETDNAAGYFDYFGEEFSGPDGRGYYSYQVGSWVIFALNSEIPRGVGSPQYVWLRNNLQLNQNVACTMAIWHRPLFTSGPNKNNPDMRDIFRLLYDFKADVVVNGHDHLYERFAPQDADGKADPARGLRQFTVGSGGTQVYQPEIRQPNSERILSTLGVIKFQLGDKAFSWNFIPVSGSPDTGNGACH